MEARRDRRRAKGNWCASGLSEDLAAFKLKMNNFEQLITVVINLNYIPSKQVSVELTGR